MTPASTASAVSPMNRVYWRATTGVSVSASLTSSSVGSGKLVHPLGLGHRQLNEKTGAARALIAALDGRHIEVHAGQIVQDHQLRGWRIERVANLEIALAALADGHAEALLAIDLQRLKLSEVIDAAIRTQDATRPPACAAAGATQVGCQLDAAQLAEQRPRAADRAIAALPARAVG